MIGTLFRLSDHPRLQKFAAFSSRRSYLLDSSYHMVSDFSIPEARPLAPRLKDGAFSSFLHDVHHAYLLLHRAFQSIPPTVIPDLVPMPHPCLEELDQPDPLQPTHLPYHPLLMRKTRTRCSTWLRVKTFHIVSPRPKSHHQFDISLLLRLPMFHSLLPVFRSPHFVPPLQLQLIVAAVRQGATWTGPFRDLVHLLVDPPHTHGVKMTYKNFATSRGTKRPDRHGKPLLAS